MPDLLTPEQQADLRHPQTFEHWLSRYDDLPWLQAIKRRAWERFLSLPEPQGDDERWRYSRLPRLLDAPLSLPAAPATPPLPLFCEAPTGSLCFSGETLLEHRPIPDALARKGVLWLPLDRAFREHPELVERYFLTQEAHLGSDKYFALHAAYCCAGAFLYVPRHVVVDAPLLVRHEAAPDALNLPHTLIIAEDNSSVTIADHYHGADDSKALAIASGESHAAPGAQIHRIVVQDYGTAVQSFQLELTAARRDAHIRHVAVNLGAARARLESQVRILESGADIRMYALTVASSEQEFDQRTYQSHEAPQATSDLLYKNALLDKAKTIFSGMIRVHKDAQRTDAYQTNRNLLLSPDAEANSMPGLEIEANDVKCSHGATSGRLDEAEMFYMRQRGLTPAMARQLLVFGFFEEILDKVPDSALAGSLRELVQEKFQNHPA